MLSFAKGKEEEEIRMEDLYFSQKACSEPRITEFFTIVEERLFRNANFIYKYRNCSMQKLL